jgi:hypothetical protein
MTQCLACAEEPTLRDILDDPIVRGVMVRDGVAAVDVEELMANLRIARDHSEHQETSGPCACAQSQPSSQCCARH